jgi:hypothetical protein
LRIADFGLRIDGTSGIGNLIDCGLWTRPTSGMMNGVFDPQSAIETVPRSLIELPVRLEVDDAPV